jgi:hypothetical protein
VTVPTPTRRLLVTGPPLLHGPDVKAVQQALGVDDDTRYGDDTADAVQRWKFRTGYPERSIDRELGVPGQRMLLGLDPIPEPFTRRAKERQAGGAPRIDAFIAGASWRLSGHDYDHDSPLRGFGQVFVECGTRHHVDPRFLAAIATHEGRLGTYRPTARIHNTFGLGPHLAYGSWQENIEAAAATLARAGAHGHYRAGTRSRPSATPGRRSVPTTTHTA